MNEKSKILNGQFQAILFDFDGVLAESVDVKTQAFAKLFEEYEDDVVKKVVDYHKKHTGKTRYEKIRHYYSDYLQKPLSDDEMNRLSDKFAKLAVENVINSEWVAGAKDFLEKYYKKVDMYVISSTPHEEIQLIVKRRNMEKYFKGVFGSPEKKDSIAKRIISNEGYSHEKVILIGDAMTDYQAAEKAGIKFLGRVPDGKKSIFPENTESISDFLDFES